MLRLVASGNFTEFCVLVSDRSVCGSNRVFITVVKINDS